MPTEAPRPTSSRTVYLACRPVSMRHGFDGLAAQVEQVFGADPFSGHLFLFRSKKAERVTSITARTWAQANV